MIIINVFAKSQQIILLINQNDLCDKDNLENLRADTVTRRG